jgi:hypothetical protein
MRDMIINMQIIIKGFVCSILMGAPSLLGKLRLSIRKHPDVANSLALLDYDSFTIYLGSEVHPDDIEECIEETLNHECIHWALFKLFGIEAAKAYDRIYGEVEPRGRVFAIGIQGAE